MGVWTSGSTIFLSVWELYVSPKSPGWKDFLQHLGVCSIVALILMGLLSVGFLWILSSVTVFATCWILMCVLLVSSKHARCFVLLVFLSCGLREGRNALIAAGTGIVIFGHMQNIFHNFKDLLDSMTCNLRAKSFSIHFPFLKKYIEAIEWIYGLAPSLNLFDDLVSWNQTLEISLYGTSPALEAHLNDTKGQVLNVWYQVMTITEALSSLGQKLLCFAGLLLVLLGTGLFLRRFLGPCGCKFENIYITRQFIQFDERERQEERPCVLPLNKKEGKKYVVIPSFWLTPRERSNLGLFLLPVLTHLSSWVLFAATDYLLYRLLCSVNTQFQGLPVLEVHLRLHGEKQGTQGIIHSSSFNISAFEPSCIPKPKLLLLKTWAPLGMILVTLLLLGLSSSFLMQLKILVSTSFYPSVERARIQYLHAKLLRKRSKQPLGEGKRKLSGYLTKFIILEIRDPTLQRIPQKMTSPRQECVQEERPHCQRQRQSSHLLVHSPKDKMKRRAEDSIQYPGYLSHPQSFPGST